MFSGIIEELGAVKRISRRGSNSLFEIKAAETLRNTKIGDSISVNGACTTVIKVNPDSFVFEAMPETIKVTNLGNLRVQDKVNLERALKIGDRISGHFTSGHVDCLGLIRRKGYVGGNLCFAEPHADPGTLLIALGAKMVAQKGSAKREIAAEDFFVDAYETSLEDDEVLCEIRVPAPGANGRSAYLKFGYLERPSVGVAIAFNLNGGNLSDVRIAVGCAGPAPKRVAEAEALLGGKSKDEAARNLAQAGAVAGRASQAISDLHGAQDYKEHIVGVLLKRAFQAALS